MPHITQRPSVFYEAIFVFGEQLKFMFGCRIVVFLACLFLAGLLYEMLGTTTVKLYRPLTITWKFLGNRVVYMLTRKTCFIHLGLVKFMNCFSSKQMLCVNSVCR